MAYTEFFKSFESDDLTMAQIRFDNFAVLKNEEMLKEKEEINHALIAEIVEESAHDDNYIDCFDPFKEFYGDDGENSDEVVDELKVVRDEEV